MIPVTVRHRFDFGPDSDMVGGDLVRSEAWDALRTKTCGPFALPGTRDALETEVARRADLATRAAAIHDLLPTGSVASYGVGAAIVELTLFRLGRRVMCGEYAPLTVDRLHAVAPELAPVQHDLLVDRPLDADWHLLHRVDTEFTNRQWRVILERFRDQQLLIVASEILPGRRVWNELRRPGVRAGWLRNRAAFERLWRRTHHAERRRAADLHGWLLIPRR